MINTSKPLLLIDLGFALFYRYSATQTWYKHSHPDEKDKLTKAYKWPENKEFMDKMSELFPKEIKELARKLKIPLCNVIIAEDCRLMNNWRIKVYPSYKSQRAESREKTGWCGAPAFCHLLSVVLPALIESTDIKLLSHQNSESDDIISQIIIKNRKDPNGIKKFYIVASDMDYFQLLNGDTELINMKGASQSEKMKYKPEEHLLEKILNGDKSDNIPACSFNANWVHILVPLKSKVKQNQNDGEPKYIKCDSKILNYYRSNPNQLLLDINHVKQNGHEYILNFERNKTLIDFREIPNNISNEIWKLYKDILNTENLHKENSHKDANSK
jgi:hypothetical protein